MAPRLRNTQAGTSEVQRLLRHHTDQALKALYETRPLSDEVVHEVRKQLKKVRADLRLLRKALGSARYAHENAAFRDAARPLSHIRDAKTLIDTFEAVVQDGSAKLPGLDLDEVRQFLLQHYQDVRQGALEEEERRETLEASLQAARARIECWPIDHRGWSVLGAGLKRVYRNGRDAFAVAQAEPLEEHWHEWRKHVKYLWHQLQVLQPLQPARLEALARQAHTLADYLGDNHDLAVLSQKLLEEPERFSSHRTMDVLTDLIVQRRAVLREQATALGRRLYEEKPGVFTHRLRKYWQQWRQEAT